MPDVYVKLRQRLEEFAIPTVPGKGILEFLRILFTKREAEILSKFKSFNRLFTVEEFAQEIGYKRSIVREVFYSLAKRNLIQYKKIANKDYFRLQPLVIGIHEAFFSTWRAQEPTSLRPAAEAIEEYFKSIFHKVSSNSRSPWARIIPSMNAIGPIITQYPEYYPVDELKIKFGDKIKRIGTIVSYGARLLIKKIISGQISDLVSALKSEIMSLLNKKNTSFIRFQGSYRIKKKKNLLKTQKIIKINKEAPAKMIIHPYEVVKFYIEKATTISITPCPCRKANRLLDEVRNEELKINCEYPVEDTCIHLRYDDEVVNEYNLRGGHIISKEEALNILDRCEKAGLVHTSFNSRDKLQFICNCCPCCCDILGTMTKYHQKYRAFVESNFQPAFRKNNCKKCATCIQKCPVKAISQDNDGFPIVNIEKCIGCGVCVSNCPKKAMILIKISDIRPAIDATESYARFANQKLVKIK